MANRLMTLDLLGTLDIVEVDVAAVAAHPFANTLIGQPWASAELRRAAVRAAIMLAQPERM